MIDKAGTPECIDHVMMFSALPAVPGGSSTDSLTPEFCEREPLYGSVSDVGDSRKSINIDHLWDYIKQKKSDKIDGFRQEYDVSRFS